MHGITSPPVDASHGDTVTRLAEATYPCGLVVEDGVTVGCWRTTATVVTEAGPLATVRAVRVTPFGLVGAKVRVGTGGDVEGAALDALRRAASAPDHAAHRRAAREVRELALLLGFGDEEMPDACGFARTIAATLRGLAGAGPTDDALLDAGIERKEVVAETCAGFVDGLDPYAIDVLVDDEGDGATLARAWRGLDEGMERDPDLVRVARAAPTWAALAAEAWAADPRAIRGASDVCALVADLLRDLDGVEPTLAATHPEMAEAMREVSRHARNTRWGVGGLGDHVRAAMADVRLLGVPSARVAECLDHVRDVAVLAEVVSEWRVSDGARLVDLAEHPRKILAHLHVTCSSRGLDETVGRLRDMAAAYAREVILPAVGLVSSPDAPGKGPDAPFEAWVDAAHAVLFSGRWLGSCLEACRAWEDDWLGRPDRAVCLTDADAWDAVLPDGVVAGMSVAVVTTTQGLDNLGREWGWIGGHPRTLRLACSEGRTRVVRVDAPTGDGRVLAAVGLLDTSPDGVVPHRVVGRDGAAPDLASVLAVHAYARAASSARDVELGRFGVWRRTTPVTKGTWARARRAWDAHVPLPARRVPATVLVEAAGRLASEGAPLWSPSHPIVVVPPKGPSPETVARRAEQLAARVTASEGRFQRLEAEEVARKWGFGPATEGARDGGGAPCP